MVSAQMLVKNKVQPSVDVCMYSAAHCATNPDPANWATPAALPCSTDGTVSDICCTNEF